MNPANMSYSQEQLAQYFSHISYPQSEHPKDALELLTNLQARQLARVPFESTSLHYSTHRTLSLDLDDLFNKVVVRSRGGYCMELNAFFGAVLRGLGYKAYNVGGRVNVGARFTGWSHMANIVIIDGKRYLVDVGFGADCSTHPVPLISGYTNTNVAPQELLLEYRCHAQHTDPEQRIWVYSTRGPEAPSADGPGGHMSAWRERYMFTDLEFFPEDFAVMNLSTMTRPNSFFVQSVIGALFVLDASSGRPVGAVTLLNDEVRRRNGDGSTELVEKLASEEDRVRALRQYFHIPLEASEQRAIRGWPTELKSL